jgi:hypothetical protein
VGAARTRSGGAGRKVPLAAALGLAAASACGGLWDVGALERRHPDLAARGAGALRDAVPYPLPLSGRLTLFLCRWEPDSPLSVSLPPDASPQERSLLELALGAWEGTAIGIEFEVAREDASARDIEIRFSERESAYTATTGAECAVDPDLGETSDVLSAEIVFARISLRRSDRDALGRSVPLSDAEILGSALHELGHALGYQGHARRGATVMWSSVDHVRRVGRRVLEGRDFEDAALEALYRVPSGAVVGRSDLPDGRTAQIDRLRELAPQLGLTGPFVRVGDHAARIAWLDADGIAHGFLVEGVRDALSDPESLHLAADGLALGLTESRLP